ncbi:MAG: SH3 domain-containing protein [Chloroflexota bacterium]
MSHKSKYIIISALIAFLVIKTSVTVEADTEHQINISATPASIILPSPLPLTTQQLSTSTATYTPTPVGPVLLEAITEANVRAEADPNAELLGTIRAGDVYPVIGRYYRWYQFQYDKSASGTGWVFDELVTITGDKSKIVDLSDNALPTANGTFVAATDTQQAITQTPGGILTATAASQIIPLPLESGNNTAIVPQTNGSSGGNPVLPTFTYPPDVPPVAPDSALRANTSTLVTPTLVPSSLIFSATEGLPPLAPILILGGLGLLGLVISSYRR